VWIRRKKNLNNANKIRDLFRITVFPSAWWFFDQLPVSIEYRGL
jgi:hypothetical protein